MDDLDLDGLLAGLGPGRRPKPIALGEIRELSLEDMLHTPGNSVIPQVKTLRQSHHQLAQLLARGASNEEASIITGYTSSRISILKSDPGFKELLAFYTEQEIDAYQTARADYAERLKSFGLDTIEELHRRLDEQPECFTNIELLKSTELISDRTGYGKTATLRTETTHKLDEESLARIRGTSTSVGVPVSEENRQALLGSPVDGSPGIYSAETPRLEGDSSPGDQLREED